MPDRGVFIGVGIDEYDCDLANLTHAVADVKAVASLLSEGFDGEPLFNATTAEANEYLKSFKNQAGGRPLVLLWSGHGSNDEGLMLATKDEADELAAATVIRHCVRSRANQLLLIIDTCQSEAALDLSQQASGWLADTKASEGRVWLGILVSCSTADYGARDGAFGNLLRKLLLEGPDSADQKRRWSKHNEYIHGEDLGNALLEEWISSDQRPHFRREGNPWYIVPNPLWTPGAPEEVVEHLLLAARGGKSDAHHSWFTGRTDEVNKIASWVTASPGVRVVTGSAGTGKSAIVGRVVSLSNPTERANLQQAERPWGHADPGERSIAAHVHARGLTADRMADELDSQLVRAGVLTPEENGKRNASLLVGALQQVVEEGKTPPVIVIDGLDEARGQSFAITDDLITRLAAYASVVVSTRPLTDNDDTELLDALSPDEVLDLDHPAHRESGRAAIRDYVRERLSYVDDAMDPSMIAAHLVDESSAVEKRPFLLARVITDQLRANHVNTTQPDWRTHIAHSIEEAFDVDLGRVEPPPVNLPIGLTAQQLARTMLTALTWGLGAGFPEEEWLTVASTLANTQLERDHVSWGVDQLGRYVVQDGEAGMAVYRLAHQSLADHLRPPYQPSGDFPFDPAATVVTTALLKRYADLLASGLPARAATYLWYYAWVHAANAGLDGLSKLRQLARSDTSLVPDVAMADLQVADWSAAWGRRTEAAAPTEEATTHYRALTTDNPAYLPNLASALNNLGIRYSEIGRHNDAVAPTEEAITHYRALAADNPGYLPDLAMALTNLGNRYGNIGRHNDALTHSEEAVTLRRAQTADNPAYLPDLAMALNNLGIRYSNTGRHNDALAPTEEATTHYRALAADNPAYQPDLASALNNLGIRYSNIGRYNDALAPTEEALTLRRVQSADNPAYLPDLAMALNNLGIRYSEIGRHNDAVAHTEEATAHYRALAADNPGYQPDLASALNNLGSCYGNIGRYNDALTHTDEAVTLRRAQTADNPAYLPDLAMALNNLGGCYTDLRRHNDAVSPTEEATTHYRALAATNPSYLPDLAGALNNLGNCYGNIGRHNDALTHTDEAVTLRRAQTADNPAYLPDLAMALNNLGGCYTDLRRHNDAVSPTEEATTHYRALAATNPSYLPDLASALNNLGTRYGNIGRHNDAVSPTEEAVTLRRVQSADNPAYLPDLAMALNNLGNRYSNIGRHNDAVSPTEEAVTHYRALAATNPSYLPNLASALNNLTQLLVLFDGGGRVEEIWRDALDSVGSDAAAMLLLYRTDASPIGSPDSAKWLRAIETTGQRDLLGFAHELGRKHWRANPDAWAKAWTEAAHESTLPAWLTVDPNKLELVEAWLATPTYEAERDHLATHPELLDEVFDVAVQEVLLACDEAEARRYLELRATAQSVGAVAAYQPLVLGSLVATFTNADPVRQQQLLEERRDELQDDLVMEYMQQHVEGDESDGRLEVAMSLLDLARTGQNEPLSATFDALNDPELFAALLESTALKSNTPALEDIALVAFYTASTEPEAANALFYGAVAGAITTNDEADERLRAAIEYNPDQRNKWISQLARIGRVHPEVLALIDVLTETDDGE